MTYNLQEYKLHDGKTISVLYDLEDICRVTKECMEMLLDLYEKGRADKYNEIASEYMLLTEEQVEQIKADVIDECIAEINKLNIEIAYPHTICNVLEQLKEQNK